MSYTMDCLKTSLPITLELLCDAVLNPAFLSEEVEEQKVGGFTTVMMHLLGNPGIYQQSLLSRKLTALWLSGLNLLA